MLLYVIMGTREFGVQSAEFIRKVFAARYGSKMEYKEILGWNVTVRNVQAALKEVLSSPEREAIIYYNGHGDQIKDQHGDESDGMDEIWQLMGGGYILDDDISRALTSIHDLSYLWLISDSCSSGTMIDKAFNDRPWMTLSSCKDNQNSLASVDGGIFTLFGLLPAVQQCNTLREIHQYVIDNVTIPTQTSQVRLTRDFLWNTQLFPLPPTFLSLRPLLVEMLKLQWLSPLYRLPSSVQDKLLPTLHCEMNSDVQFENFHQKYLVAGINSGWLHPHTHCPLCPYSSKQTQSFLQMIA